MPLAGTTEKMPLLRDHCSGLKGFLLEIRVPVYLLVILFAMASWIDINGLWTELPLLVNELPEAWDLPSYLIIIIQVANIGPICYTLTNRCAPNKVKEWPVIYLIILVGVVACALLIFFWDETNYIFGEERSTSLLLLSFFLAMVDTTSSVVFLPYMANFKVQYMSAFYIGEGMSGFLPAMVGLIQGVGSDPDCRNISVGGGNDTNTTEYALVPFYDPPLFSVEIFFIFLLCMLISSGVSFSILNFSGYCKHEMIRTKVVNADFAFDNQIELENSEKTSYIITNNGDKTPQDHTRIQLDEIGRDKDSFRLNKIEFAYLFLSSIVINGLSNGVIPSTASYSALPYGNRAYNLSTRIGMAANPLACFIALFLPCKSLPTLGGLTLSGIALAGYQLYLADMSPRPPLQEDAVGEFLVVRALGHYSRQKKSKLQPSSSCVQSDTTIKLSLFDKV